MSSEKPKQTLNGIFDDFLRDIKKSKNVVEDIGNLRTTVLDFVKNNTESPRPENPIITDISRALDQIDRQSGDLEIREKVEKLNEKLKDGGWKTWVDLTT